MQNRMFAKLRAQRPGLALGLGRVFGDGPAEIKVAGPLRQGGPETVDASAKWHIGSITKTLTAVLVLQFAERGVVDLESPIGPYLPHGDELHPSWQNLTLAALLSHTSGLAANPHRKQFPTWRDIAPELGRRRILQELWDTNVPGRAGKFRYSNLGYMLAGHVIETKLGIAWENLILSHIAKPLGLKSLGFGAPRNPTDPEGHRRSLFSLTPIERDNPGADNPPWLGPAGTIHMSIPDILTFGQAMLRATRGTAPEFLSQASAELMQQPKSGDYGLGVIVEGDIIWHNGSNTMWYAQLMMDHANQSVAVVTQNAMTRVSKLDALVRKSLLPSNS